MPMLPDERFSNRPQYRGGSPLTQPGYPEAPGAGGTPTYPLVPGGPTGPLQPPIPPGGLSPTPPPIMPPLPGSGPYNTGGVETLPSELIGDIPPPPIPPPPITGPGVAGIRGTEAGTLARPGSAAARPFRTAAYTPKPQRFGPGVPVSGGDTTGVTGLGNPDDVAELLRQLAAGRAQG
jgi:hypothetical protein